MIGEARRGRKLVFSGDTAPCDMTRGDGRHGADLLVHEATFSDEERDRARETGHSTAPPGRAMLAADADVALLALTHVSTRYPAASCATRRAPSSSDTIVPRDFDAIEIPFPERGEPDPRRALDD